jgi:hypothetical protein
MAKYDDKVNKWESEGIGKSFSDIRMEGKLMPSAHTKENKFNFEWSNHTTREEKNDPAAKTNYYYDKSFHVFQNTEGLLPVLNFTEENVPQGDSENICMHATWTEKE